MRKFITGTTIACIFLGMSINAVAGNSGGGKRLVLNVVGTGIGYTDWVADIDGDGLKDEATCFDVLLFNAKNRQFAGTATDCLSNIEEVDEGGLALVGTTTFRMRRGVLTVRGNTSVQPVTQPITTPDGQDITHITGAASMTNAVIEGTRGFAGATGTSRLSGMVNLSIPGEITFDCLFVIDLD
jgi:hypothetical protein